MTFADVTMRTQLNTTCYYQFMCFQCIYNCNVPLRRGSDRSNLLHRRARNHFLLNFVLLRLKRPIQRSKFRPLQPTRLLRVFAKKNAHIFTRFFQESESFCLTQRYHEQGNDCVHNSQNLQLRRLKLPYKILLCHSLAWLSTKKFVSRASGSIKTTRTPAFCLSFNCIFAAIMNSQLRWLLRDGPFVSCAQWQTVELSTVW